METKYLLCLLIVLYANIASSQRDFIDLSRNEDQNRKKINEKVYFPGKTNEDEVNLKRLANALIKNYIHEQNTNRLEENDEGEEKILSVASETHHTVLQVNKGIKPLIKHSDFSVVHNNESPLLVNKLTDKIQNSYEDSDEEKTTSLPLNRKNSSKSMSRIPPPSVLSSASTSSTLRVCEIKYAEYIQRIFPREADTASDANDKEFHGRVLAAPGQYPHMTALGFRSFSGKTDYKCGGSLISETFVITAAHCANFTGLQPTKVRIGDLNLMIEESYLEPQIRNIKKIYVHPDYKKTSYYNDIALLELDREVEFTEFVRPIRLWTQETFLHFTMAYAMGYGATDFARERTNRLTNLNMTLVPNDECNRQMPKLPETKKGILPSQICAIDYALNRDTCQGDSGGPLQFNIRGRRSTNRLHYQLIGITSYGLHCRSGYPSIFTRVCSFLDWIEPIVWRDYFD